ncbi:hypothetical protein RZS08_57770 [Arthrospira platensis SPKY1]|nr:hypothetical protein [Arthrospira platensis SPKY1]
MAYTAPSAQVFYRDYAAPLGAPQRVLTAAERRVFFARIGASQWTEHQLRDGTMLHCLLHHAPMPEHTLEQLGTPQLTLQTA